MPKRKKPKMFDDTGEMVLWNKFKKYNRIKYLSLFLLGTVFGWVIAHIVFVVIY